MFVFGDSLGDVGNNNHLPFSILKANFPHNGIDYPGRKPTGRFSNGKNTVDFIAEKINLPTSPPPYLAVRHAKPEAFMNGVNFASGGAGVLDSTNKKHSITLDEQIEYYSKVHSQLSGKLERTGLQAYLSKSLFAVVVGSNDIFAHLKSKHAANDTSIIDQMVSTHRQQLKKLYELGARKFAMIGTGPIGCTPSLREHGKSKECNEEANRLAVDFGVGVGRLMHGMSSELVDVNYTFFNTTVSLLDYIQNPREHGFVEVKAACCGLGDLKAKIACLPFSTYCSNRDHHIFWDFYHPTQIVSRMSADIIFHGSAPFTSPLNLNQLFSL